MPNVQAFTFFWTRQPGPTLSVPADVCSEHDARETCTLTELARMAGRSTKVVKGWLRECQVPIYGQSIGRHIYVDDLRVLRPEVRRLFERRAEKRSHGERVSCNVHRDANGDRDDEAA